MYVDDDATLLDIAQACREIEDFLDGFDQESFMRDRKTQLSVLYALAVIGEAVKRLSEAFRSGHIEVPWGKIAGTRDVLVHAYDQVDLEEVWRIATGDVPDLLKYVEPLVPEEGA